MKLTEVESMHEQRERFDFQEINVHKGIWLEVVNFNPHTEDIEILKRLEVEDVVEIVDKDFKRYKIICNELDIGEDNRRKKEIINQIIEKHNDKLKASFAKCLIDGIDFRSIPELRNIINRMGNGE